LEQLIICLLALEGVKLGIRKLIYFAGKMQVTVAKSVPFKGIGVHLGLEVNMVIKPAVENSGITFKRVDLKENNIIPASYENVVDTRLCTLLANAFGAKVSTIEHVMSALWALGVDNAVIEVDGEEMPIMDGSAKVFYEAIKNAGLKTQSERRKYIKILKEVSFEDGDKVIKISPFDSFMVQYEINFAHPAIGSQDFLFIEDVTNYEHEISAARTFGFAHEIEALKKMGLARGGSLANAVGIDENGVMNPEGLRYRDEFIRHKVLDCLGDLYLAGFRILGRVQAYKAGHGVHNQLLRKLLDTPNSFELVETKPIYHPSVKAEAELRAWL
jgi:UDP-3-O-[3-hydroxymyristoyl] N-acetylglucosamine deacetylase